MNTYSHMLITAALGQVAKKHTDWNVHTGAMLLGSVMPDLPLFALTLGYWLSHNPFARGESPFGPAYDTLFFTDPLWVISHNFFHAPLIIVGLALAGYAGMRRGAAWGRPLFWFALACGLHSAIDIPTHGDDGPLLLFPFNWELRYASPVSYWDPRYGGDVFTIYEHLLDLAILVFLGFTWWQGRARRKATLPSDA